MVLRGCCLLIGARGFFGRHIEKILQYHGIDVVGTTRALAHGDPGSWLQYEFLREPIGKRIRDLHFDFVIIAARLARATIEAKHSRETGALYFDAMFRELSRTTRRPRVTYLSSDAVFSGARGGYTEIDEPDSSESYGSMQIIAERSLSAHVPNHLIMRTSFLFDLEDVRTDRRLSRMLNAVKSRMPVYADTNVYKSPVNVVHAAHKVVERTLMGQTGVVHVSGKRQSLYEFFESSLDRLGVPEFREHLIARESAQRSDTSLQSVFERSMA